MSANVLMLRNSEDTVGGLQLSAASKVTVVEKSEITMVLSSDIQLYSEERLGLGVQQESPNCYSYGGANSHKSCVDQGDR